MESRERDIGSYPRALPEGAGIESRFSARFRRQTTPHQRNRADIRKIAAVTDSPVPRVGVGIVISRDGELLLQRRINVHGTGTWSTPGGHLEPGEDPRSCAIREAAEETGLAVEHATFVGVTNDVFDDERHYITLWFVADGVTGEPSLSAPYEMSELRWFRRGQLPHPLFPPLQRLLEGDHLGPGLRRQS